MKPLLFLSLLLLFVTPTMAQNHTVHLSHYVFPDFLPGEVLMKNGLRNKALLNYNSLTDEMVFVNNEEKLAIADDQLAQIDTVYILKRKFFRLDGQFVELLHQNGYEFYCQYKCSIKYPKRPDAFGRTSNTSSNESYTFVNVIGRVYELELPDGYDTKPYMHYWLKKNGKPTRFKNVSQLLKRYGAKKNTGKDYIKQNNLLFDNPAHMAQLIAYLERA